MNPSELGYTHKRQTDEKNLNKKPMGQAEMIKQCLFYFST